MHACLRDNNQRSIFKENNSTGFLFINYLSLLFIWPYVFSLLIRLCSLKKNLLCFYCAKNDHFCSSLIFFLFVWLICRCLWFLWWRETKVKRVIRPTTLFVCLLLERKEWLRCQVCFRMCLFEKMSHKVTLSWSLSEEKM